MRKSAVLLIVFLIIPSAFSISLNDLINWFNFDFSGGSINATYYDDLMADKDNNNINDTFILELETNGNSWNYLVSVIVYDTSEIKNETNKTLSAGINRFNITFPTDFFTKNMINYTIKIYDENY